MLSGGAAQAQGLSAAGTIIDEISGASSVPKITLKDSTHEATWCRRSRPAPASP